MTRNQCNTIGLFIMVVRPAWWCSSMPASQPASHPTPLLRSPQWSMRAQCTFIVCRLQLDLRIYFCENATPLNISMLVYYVNNVLQMSGGCCCCWKRAHHGDANIETRACASHGHARPPNIARLWSRMPDVKDYHIYSGTRVSFHIALTTYGSPIQK